MFFAKPKFIVYDEWFDDNLKTINPYDKNKKITNTLNTHTFYYENLITNFGPLKITCK